MHTSFRAGCIIQNIEGLQADHLRLDAVIFMYIHEINAFTRVNVPFHFAK